MIEGSLGMDFLMFGVSGRDRGTLMDPHVRVDFPTKVMALADAADQLDWVEVQRLLRAGPRLSVPQGPNCPHWSVVSRNHILELVLGHVKH